MIAVSDDYKKAVSASDRADRITGTIVLNNGAVVDVTDDIIINNSITLKEQIVSGETIEIGTFNTNELNITISDENASSQSYANAKITLFYGIQLSDGSWENIPLGVFTVDNSYTKRKGRQQILTAFDCSVRFDRDISHHAARQTVTEHILTSCEELSVELADGFDISDYPNASEMITTDDNSIQTYRDIIETCTAIMGASARINRYGKFEIIRLVDKSNESGEYEYDKTISGDERFGTEYFDLRAIIKYISTIIDGKNTVFTLEKTVNDEQCRNAVLNIPENPLLKSNENAEKIFKKSIEQLSLVLRKADFTFVGDPAIECFDTLCISGGQIVGKDITVFPTKLTWKYRNRHTVSCAFAEITDEKSSESGEQQIPLAVKDKTNKRIDGITSGSSSGSQGTSFYVDVGTGNVNIRNIPEQILRVRFTATTSTVPFFASTIPFEVTKEGNVAFNVIYDGTTINTYTELCNVGQHFKTITLPVIGVRADAHILSVTVVSGDAEGTVNGLKSYGVLFGAGLAENIMWDGRIDIRERITEFLRLGKWHKKLVAITDTMLCTFPEMHTITFKETPKAFVHDVQWRKKHEEITDRLPLAWEARINADQPLRAWNTSDTEVYIEMTNPVTTDGALDPAAFSMSITNEQQTIIDITPTEAYIDALSDLSDGQIGGRIRLIFAEETMRESVQEIALFYYSAVGNLRDAVSGTTCEDFRTAFDYTAH